MLLRNSGGGKLPLYPVQVAPLGFLQLETSTVGSSRNYAAWFPVALYFVVDYPKLIRGKS